MTGPADGGAVRGVKPAVRAAAAVPRSRIESVDLLRGLMVALMVLGAGDARRISPMSLMFPLMMLASMAMMFNPQGSGQDPDETRRTYLRHLKALREQALDRAAAQRAHFAEGGSFDRIYRPGR